MSHSTNLKQSDTLHTQNNVDETRNNTSLAEREQIEGTPFWLIKQNDNWFIVMGNHRLTEPTKNKETQLIKLENEKWKLIMNISIIMAQKILEEYTVNK